MSEDFIASRSLHTQRPAPKGGAGAVVVRSEAHLTAPPPAPSRVSVAPTQGVGTEEGEPRVRGDATRRGRVRPTSSGLLAGISDPGTSALRVAAAAAVAPLRVLVRVLTCAMRKTEVTAEFFSRHAVTSVVCAFRLARNHAPSLFAASVVVPDRGSDRSLTPVCRTAPNNYVLGPMGERTRPNRSAFLRVVERRGWSFECKLCRARFQTRALAGLAIRCCLSTPPSTR
jgi:hypothetical protein